MPRPSGSPAAGAFAAFPDLLLSGVFLWTWLAPQAIDDQMVKRLCALMVMEFIVMHSAPACGWVMLSPVSRPRKAVLLSLLGAFYMLFAWGFSEAFEAAWPLYSFFGLILNRLLGVLVGAVPHGAEAKYVISVWIIGAVSYILGVAFTAVLPVPALGVTPEVIAAQHFTASGLWIAEPWRALACGALYFGVVGVWEILGRAFFLRAAPAMRHP